MMSNGLPADFREGDQVVLDRGTYEGTPGIFTAYRKDVNWADITERDGSIRSHPVAWLAHAQAAVSHSASCRPRAPRP